MMILSTETVHSFVVNGFQYVFLVLKFSFFFKIYVLYAFLAKDLHLFFTFVLESVRFPLEPFLILRVCAFLEFDEFGILLTK